MARSTFVITQNGQTGHNDSHRPDPNLLFFTVMHRDFWDTRMETVAICHIRAAVNSKNQDSDIWTEVIQGLWSNNLEQSSR